MGSRANLSHLVLHIAVGEGGQDARTQTQSAWHLWGRRLTRPPLPLALHHCALRLQVAEACCDVLCRATPSDIRWGCVPHVSAIQGDASLVCIHTYHSIVLVCVPLFLSHSPYSPVPLPHSPLPTLLLPPPPPSLYCVVVSLCVCVSRTAVSPLMDSDTVFMDKCQVGCTHTHARTHAHTHARTHTHTLIQHSVETSSNISSIFSSSIPSCVHLKASFIDFVVYPLWEVWAELLFPHAQIVLKCPECRSTGQT